ncbi:MAG TPA: Gfo/Idh/MocA family oxidoreductase, partial [Lapillicoccus sp.]|nr:Gfo/Idh/MocA family oxidoreductase [Lapillicoccus sp.]
MTAALGLGLVGAGRFGEFVAGVAGDLPEVSLRAVADAESGRAAALAARHGAQVAGDWTTLIDHRGVDAVVVATPPATHAAVALAALAAGRHVFCEKPLATTLDRAREVVEAAGRRGRALVVDHVLRYNPVL